MSETTTDDLGRNTAVMAAGTVLSRLTGFGRVLALAYALDFQRLADAYNLANTTPNIVYELVLGGVLSATLIPVFVDQLGAKDERTAWHNISALLTLATAVMAAMAAVAFIAAPLVIRAYTAMNDTPSADDQRAVATTLLRYFAPQVLLLGLIALSTALLNARRRFAAPMWSPILLNLWTIGMLVAFAKTVDDRGIGAVRHNHGALLLLGLGTTLGYLVQFLAVVPSLRAAGARLRPVWDPGNEAVRLVLRLSAWTVGVVIANQVSYWVVIVLTGDDSGGLSSYQAAFQFFQLPHAILAVSIMSALMPDLSLRWTQGDRAGFNEQLRRGLRTTAAVLIPAAAGYALLAHPLVRVLLQHGNLSPDKANLTADVLTLFALGLPGFSLYLLCMRAYQAMKDTKTMFFLYAAENAGTVVLALALFPLLGVPGLAVAFTAPYTVFTVVALRRLGVGVGNLARVLAATAGMSLAVGALRLALHNDVLVLGSAVALGAAVYVGLAKALGVDDLVALLRFRRRPT